MLNPQDSAAVTLNNEQQEFHTINWNSFAPHMTTHVCLHGELTYDDTSGLATFHKYSH